MKTPVGGVVGVIAGLVLMSPAVNAATIVAYPPQGICPAVLASSPGDTILVSPGTYGPELGVVIQHPLTIIGIGGSEMNEIGICYDLCAGFLFRIDVQDVVIEGLTLTTSDFEPFPGLAIAVYVWGGEAVIRDCVFRDLRIGVNVFWGTVELRSCLFYGEDRGNRIGVRMEAGSGEIVNNTFASSANGVFLSEGASPLIARNIFAFNEEIGVRCSSGSAPTFECNDAWNNSAGNYVGCADPTGTDGNISVDPLLCSLTGSDFGLQSGSPCLPENSPPGCGLIGAFGSCEPVVSIPDAGSAALRLVVAPNPVRRGAEISYDSRLRNPTIEIYDAQGRAVDIVHPLAPPYVWQPDASTRPGIYFVRLRGERRSATTKVVLLPR